MTALTERRVDRPVLRRFLRAGLLLLAVSVVAGGLHAWLWATFAPGVQYQVFDNQSWAPLPTETQHHFVSFAVFALVGLVIGVATAALAWQFRPVRGAAMLLICGVCAAVGSGLARWVGPMWDAGIDPATVAATPGVQTIVTSPALIPEGAAMWSALAAAPTTAVLVYTVLVTWNGLPDLARTSTL